MIRFEKPLEPISAAKAEQEFFLVNHGRNGLLGNFAVDQPLALARGDQVVVETARGLEIGTVLCPASERQSRLLGGGFSGRLLRIVNDSDRCALSAIHIREQELFLVCKRLMQTLALPLEIIDVELLLNAQRAWLNIVGSDQVDFRELQIRLAEESGVEVFLENVAVVPANHDDDHSNGCGKPDCGKTLGGCSSCGSGGGCSTCGAGTVDLRPYFARLREQIETKTRVPLN